MQYLLATAFDLPVGILYSSASERIQVLAEIDHDKLHVIQRTQIVGH